MFLWLFCCFRQQKDDSPSPPPQLRRPGGESAPGSCKLPEGWLQTGTGQRIKAGPHAPPPPTTPTPPPTPPPEAAPKKREKVFPKFVFEDDTTTEADIVAFAKDVNKKLDQYRSPEDAEKRCAKIVADGIKARKERAEARAWAAMPIEERNYRLSPQGKLRTKLDRQGGR
ncbi:uncharacterized protein KY384_007319 [Bacidia gigantensis]|uniref:uncharacterized protein n=1 Tax=Bacidia gigantensis TaxID=2732470 RepID=UPI001D04D154|nr:uncharacterized protein KY384_007319 [Bacidia gigantensis]KAG8528401.1 hypothetical protein KY384_007319 [Bacidia gigantensis]